MITVSYADGARASTASHPARAFLRRLAERVPAPALLRSGARDPQAVLAAMTAAAAAGWQHAGADQGAALLLLDAHDPEPALPSAAPAILMVVGTRPAPWEATLRSGGYAFAWCDGTHRYLLAAEHAAALAPAFADPLPEEAWPAPYIDSDDRIAMTLRNRDADRIPKVPDAGRVLEQPDGSRLQVMHNGLRVVADGYGGAWTTRLIEGAAGHHEPQEEHLFHEVVSRLPAKATMLELGGYWAYYSLWFLRGGSGRRAVVVEPDPANMAVGKANAALNGLTPEFVQGFVGAEPGPARPFQTESSGLLEVPCLSVPALLAERGIAVLDLLHCDAQGAELSVLESCRDLLLRGAIRWVFVSTHAALISGDHLTHQRCLALLRGLGGWIVAEHEVHESFSGDGLIVAWFGDGEPDVPPLASSHNRYGEAMFRNPLYDLARTSQELAALRGSATVAQDRLASAQARALAAEADAAALRASTSWRVTEPLRRLMAVFDARRR